MVYLKKRCEEISFKLSLGIQIQDCSSKFKIILILKKRLTIHLPADFETATPLFIDKIGGYFLPLILITKDMPGMWGYLIQFQPFGSLQP